MKQILLKIVKKRLAIKGHNYDLNVATFCENCVTATKVMNKDDLKSFIKDNFVKIKLIALPSHRGLVDNLEALCR